MIDSNSIFAYKEGEPELGRIYPSDSHSDIPDGYVKTNVTRVFANNMLGYNINQLGDCSIFGDLGSLSNMVSNISKMTRQLIQRVSMESYVNTIIQNNEAMFTKSKKVDNDKYLLNTWIDIDSMCVVMGVMMAVSSSRVELDSFTSQMLYISSIGKYIIDATQSFNRLIHSGDTFYTECQEELINNKILSGDDYISSKDKSEIYRESVMSWAIHFIYLTGVSKYIPDNTTRFRKTIPYDNSKTPEVNYYKQMLNYLKFCMLKIDYFSISKNNEYYDEMLDNVKNTSKASSSNYTRVVYAMMFVVYMKKQGVILSIPGVTTDSGVFEMVYYVGIDKTKKTGSDELFDNKKIPLLSALDNRQKMRILRNTVIIPTIYTTSDKYDYLNDYEILFSIRCPSSNTCAAMAYPWLTSLLVKDIQNTGINLQLPFSLTIVDIKHVVDINRVLEGANGKWTEDNLKMHIVSDPIGKISRYMSILSTKLSDMQRDVVTIINSYMITSYDNDFDITKTYDPLVVKLSPDKNGYNYLIQSPAEGPIPTVVLNDGKVSKIVVTKKVSYDIFLSDDNMEEEDNPENAVDNQDMVDFLNNTTDKDDDDNFDYRNDVLKPVTVDYNVFD